MPYRVIPGPLDGVSRERLVCAFQLLQAGNVRSACFQPMQQVWETPVDVVDVEGSDLHRARQPALPVFATSFSHPNTERPSSEGERSLSPAMKASSEGPFAVRSSCRAWSSRRLSAS